MVSTACPPSIKIKSIFLFLIFGKVLNEWPLKSFTLEILDKSFSTFFFFHLEVYLVLFLIFFG